jgi:hypothetical protein
MEGNLSLAPTPQPEVLTPRKEYSWFFHRNFNQRYKSNEKNNSRDRA